MKKQSQVEKDNNEIDYKQSKHRLIEQNRHLYMEIFKLQNKISSLLTKNITKQFKQKTQNIKSNTDCNQEAENQILLIKQLKRKILLIKNAQKPQQKQDVRQALDELTFLKKQKQKYKLQKEALFKKTKIRNQALELNKPIQGELKNILSLYKSTQHENNSLKAKSLKLQKSINNLHKIKELAKSAVPKTTQNYQLDMRVIKNQISTVQKQITDIQRQWSPRVESLNNEYFVLKQIKEEKQQQIQDLSKIMNTLKNRVLVMKQESQILKDKLRLSQIIVSPEKREEINQIYRSQQQKKQFFKQFTQRPNIGIKIMPSATQKVLQNPQKKLLQVKQQKIEKQIKSSRIFKTQISLGNTKNTQKQLQKQSLDFNEFQIVKSSGSQTVQKNPTKILASVAVGTTFYYNGQD